jgi:hypothetical protein
MQSCLAAGIDSPCQSFSDYSNIGSILVHGLEERKTRCAGLESMRQDTGPTLGRW